MLKRRCRFGFLCLVTVLVACGNGTDRAWVPQNPNQPLRVFIFAGQSNMEGDDAIIDPSKIKDLVEVGKQTPADSSSKFTLGGAESYPWGDIRGHQGSSFGKDTMDGLPIKVHGPEVGFNRALGGNIAIIAYAKNYHALENGRSSWVRPGSQWTAWQSFVDAQLDKLQLPYLIEGFVWEQGIDDGILKRDEVSYEADLRQIIRDLREEFGNKP